MTCNCGLTEYLLFYRYDTGNINGILAMKQFRDQFSTGFTDTIDGQDNQPDFTAAQKALIVSILSAGTFFGALFAAPVADKIGRRYGLMVSCVIFIIGALLQVASSDIPVFAVGRCVAGLGVGMLSTLVPLYQAET